MEELFIYNVHNKLNMKKGLLVKYRAPGWENKIGKICSVNGDKVMVQFGKHDFVELYSGDLVIL